MQKKGQERLTIMLIPHESHQIFSLQLSWGIITFVCLILIGLSLLATFAIYQRYQQHNEKQQLIQRYGSNLESVIKLESLAKKNTANYKITLSHLKKLAKYSSFSQHGLDLPISYSQAQQKAKELLSAGMKEPNSQKDPRHRNLLPPIYTLKSLYLYAKEQLPLLKKIHLFYSNGFGIYNHIPLGRPFKNFNGLRDTSGYGKRIDPVRQSGAEFHGGYDIAGSLGTPILATATGKVYKSHYNPNGYGRTVILEHSFGYYSVYAHLSRIHVSIGQNIKRGQLLGAMGRSGRTTGPHLHYEIWQGNRNRINPRPFICAGDHYTNSCLHYHSRQNY